MKIKFSDFEKIDIRVGTILTAVDFLEGKYSSHILEIDFGPELGTKKSLAKMTPTYTSHELIGKQVLAVVNFEPRQIGKHMSEVLTLGVPDKEGNIILVSPEKPVPNSSKLF